MKQYNIEDIKPFLESYSIKGNGENKFFTHVKPIGEAEKDTLVWVSPLRHDKQTLLENTKSEIVICDSSLDITENILNNKCCIITKNPKLTFLRIANELFNEKKAFGIHPNAILHREAKIDLKVYIGPGTYVGKCTIGSNTFIHGNCFIYDNTIIGSNVTISAGAIIGAEGFGYSKNEEGEFEKFPHIGGVVIEDNVDIGANTCIDRGSLGNTIIKAGAKIDNLVHIAHNVIVGKNTAVIAHAMIGGSTVIGDSSWVAPSASIRDGITIGNETIVGLGAVVTKNIPDNEVWAGVPAKKFR